MWSTHVVDDLSVDVSGNVAKRCIVFSFSFSANVTNNVVRSRLEASFYALRPRSHPPLLFLLRSCHHSLLSLPHAPLLRHRRVGSTCLAELASRTDGMVSLRVSPALRGTYLFFFVFFCFFFLQCFFVIFLSFHLFLKDFRHMTHTRHTLVLSRRLMQLLL